MSDEQRAKALSEGIVALVWLVVISIFELIAIIALFIWQTKIALFLFGVITVLWIIVFIIFILWKKSLKKYKKN